MNRILHKMAPLALGLLALPGALHAQNRTFIRGIPYVDHSRSTRLSQNTVGLGGRFQITSRTLRFSGRQSIRVTLQDVRRGNGFGVTAFQLRNVRRLNASTLSAQAPAHLSFANRRFHVAVFVYERGRANQHASAGTLMIQRQRVRRPTPRRTVRPRSTRY